MEEIEEIVKEMQNGKAPRPDGFNVDFFKACCKIVKQDILEVVEDSQRFKKFLKLDIAKGYDKLSWSYVREILKAYGFNHDWIKWVMALVTTTNCSILLNGAPSKTFMPSRGLRQGDPLSPFFFILMMEGLGRNIKAAKEEGRIQGLRLTNGGDTVTHQQFVDDTMLHGTPTVKEAKAFKQILSEFDRVAGTEVCLFKQTIFFFNIDISIQRNISRILGFQRETLLVKYLRVPLTTKLLHRDIWEPVLNKLKDKISEWTNRALNLVGRLVLTKVVLQCIPIYMLFAIPALANVLTNIRNIQRDFLWGKYEEKSKWALVAWDRVCKPKSHGGLGLHDPGILNRILGAKIWWRSLKENKAPWAKVWKHNMLVNGRRKI
eukprot:PITA_35003